MSKHKNNKRISSTALITGGMSAGIAIADTAVICALTGFSISVTGAIGIGAGIFALTFTAFACCNAASRADESLGYK